VAKRHDGPIHLLISDVVMPNVGGPELAARLAEDRPDLVVLYISGYAPDGALAARAPGRGADFLQKPFTARQLATAARRVLDHLGRV
jgi:two-component system, cell cycle sensor histidine kinase and response regulator CckA